MAIKKHQVLGIDCPVCLSELRIDPEEETVEARYSVSDEREKLEKILRGSSSAGGGSSEGKEGKENGEGENSIQNIPEDSEPGDEDPEVESGETSTEGKEGESKEGKRKGIFRSRN